MSKVYSGKNHFLLALAVVYFIIAGIQISVDGLLSIRFYFSIALISVCTTGCEFIKSAIKLIRLLRGQMSDMDSMMQSDIMKHIDVLGQFPFLTEITEQYRKDAEKMKISPETKAAKVMRKTLEKIEAFIPFIEALLIMLFCLITPLLEIPNDLEINKVINTLSIISVAFAFFSICVNETVSEMIEREEEKFKSRFRTSDYYLGIIKLISMKCSAEQNVAKKGVSDPQNDNN